MANLYPGVTYYNEQRGQGPFMIRISGTRKFVASIQDNYYSRWGSPREGITLVEGWNNSKTMIFETMDEALKAANKVCNIEGCHTSIETILSK